MRGHAEVRATRDRAWVSPWAVNQGPTASDVVDKNVAAMPGVFVAGITDADIGATGFNVSPVFDDVNRSRQAPRIVAYCVSNTVTVGAEYGRGWLDVGCVNKARGQHTPRHFNHCRRE